MLDVDKVRTRLPEGWRLQWHQQVTSTNDLALQAARAGEPEGLVIGAETQTRGRGRFGRRWMDVPGRCLLFSVLLRPPEHVARELVGMAAAVAVAEAAGRHGAPLSLHWPNDLYWQGRKVCGILTEATGQAVVVGVGINVARADALPAELNAASVSEAAGAEVDRADLLADCIQALARRYRELCAGQTSVIVQAARQADDLAGRRVVVQLSDRQVSGPCLGIDDGGRLVIETQQGKVALAAGEVVDVRERC